MNLRIAVCDDEAYYRERVACVVEENLIVQGITDYKIDIYNSSEELCRAEEQIKEYHAMFLDVSMPEVDGMQLAKHIRKIQPNMLLVFITAYVEFAPAGYELNALRYILKENIEEYMPEAIRTILRKLELQSIQIAYDFLEGKQRIYINQLYYIESAKHKLQFHMGNSDVYTLYAKLDQLEEQLSPHNFIRTHKSFLVNYRHIQTIGNYKLTLDNGEQLPIPRERFHLVRERFYELRGGLQ